MSYSNPISYYLTMTNPGVVITWERSGTASVTAYKISYSTQRDGSFTELATVDFPAKEYVHSDGHPSYWYLIQELNVSEVVVFTHKPIIGDEFLIMQTLYYELREFMEINVHDHMPFEWNKTRTSCRWNYKDWNVFPQPQLRISSTTSNGASDPFIVLSPYTGVTSTTDAGTDYASGLYYTLDYNGNAFFVNSSGTPVSVQSYDTITADYSVKMVTTSEMNDALEYALQWINAQPGVNKFAGVTSTPFYYDAALITGATYIILRRILKSLNNRERRLLLLDPDDKFDQLKSDVDLYKEDWNKLLEMLPKARYPRTLAIVTPEMIMPGGRSRYFRQIWTRGI